MWAVGNFSLGERLINKHIYLFHPAEEFKHWKFRNGGDGFRVEDTPVGSHPLEKFTEVKGRKNDFSHPVTCRVDHWHTCIDGSGDGKGGYGSCTPPPFQLKKPN